MNTLRAYHSRCPKLDFDRSQMQILDTRKTNECKQKKGDILFSEKEGSAQFATEIYPEIEERKDRTKGI